MRPEINELIQKIDASIVEERYDDTARLSFELFKTEDASGYYYMGICYSNGYGMEEDCEKALACFDMSAKKGYEKAESLLLCAYLMINTQEYEDAAEYAAEAYALGEKSAAGAAGCAYHLSDNNAEAAKWYKRSFEAGDDEALIYLGRISTEENDYEQAAIYLSEALKRNVEGARVAFSDACASYALELREYAAKQLNMSEYTQYNAAAVTNALQAQAEYTAAVDAEPDSMSVISWVLFGKMGQLMYNLACRGELNAQVSDNSAKSYISNSIRMTLASMSGDDHLEWWDNAMQICAIMDRHGAGIVAEYTRAGCCLLDAECHHSAQAFYRARWHMKRVGELRASQTLFDEEDMEILFNSMSEVDKSAQKLNKKYGAIVREMIQSGQYPDIQREYPDGMAPHPSECENFMSMYNDMQNPASASAATGKSAVKRLFGIFGRKG